VAVRVDLGERMGRFHRTYDLLLTPTLPITAFPKGADVPPGWHSSDWTSWTPYSYPFNLTQQPAITVPCGLSSGGLPIGLQLVGPMFADALVLRAAHAYERLHPAPRPPVQKTVLNPGQHRS
jgi:aspartyl-tRNA(Asn)/glutamyl-tRNA(Gln) amidotransferase subunit A